MTSINGRSTYLFSAQTNQRRAQQARKETLKAELICENKVEDSAVKDRPVGGFRALEAGEIKEVIISNGKKEEALIREESISYVFTEQGYAPLPSQRTSSSQEVYKRAQKVELKKAQEDNSPLENTLNGVVYDVARLGKEPERNITEHYETLLNGNKSTRRSYDIRKDGTLTVTDSKNINSMQQALRGETKKEVREFQDGKEFFEYLQKNGKSRANASIDELYKEYLSATPEEEIKNIYTGYNENRNFTLYKDGRLECEVKKYNNESSTLSFEDGEEFLNHLKNNNKLSAEAPLEGLYEVYQLQKEENEYFSISKSHGKFEKHYFLNEDNQLTSITFNGDQYNKATFEQGKEFIEYLKETNKTDSPESIEKLYDDFVNKQNEVLQTMSIKFEDGSKRTLNLLGSGALEEIIDQNGAVSQTRYTDGKEFLNYILLNNKLNDEGNVQHNLIDLYGEFVASKNAPAVAEKIPYTPSAPAVAQKVIPSETPTAPAVAQKVVPSETPTTPAVAQKVIPSETPTEAPVELSKPKTTTYALGEEGGFNFIIKPSVKAESPVVENKKPKTTTYALGEEGGFAFGSFTMNKSYRK